ncbi:MAG: cytochrome o ubiquinol oxidase subunit IV [Coxiellaceae bacterium]|nr:cytochrome o ubiquinol oxidase subunit IV [Coxiellaceae bacterium]
MSDHDHPVSTVSTGTGRKTFTTYIVGFLGSLFLTIIAFFAVGNRIFDDAGLYIAVSVLAVIQLYVQVIFFLRVNAGKQSRLNLLSFLFTILIIVVILSGSIWIMYNLNVNMMR